MMMKINKIKKIKKKINKNKVMMFKIIMIGNSGTGKSCLFARYTRDQF